MLSLNFQHRENKWLIIYGKAEPVRQLGDKITWSREMAGKEGLGGGV